MGYLKIVQDDFKDRTFCSLIKCTESVPAQAESVTSVNADGQVETYFRLKGTAAHWLDHCLDKEYVLDFTFSVMSQDIVPLVIGHMVSENLMMLADC